MYFITVAGGKKGAGKMEGLKLLGGAAAAATTLPSNSQAMPVITSTAMSRDSPLSVASDGMPLLKKEAGMLHTVIL